MIDMISEAVAQKENEYLKMRLAVLKKERFVRQKMLSLLIIIFIKNLSLPEINN